MGEAQQRQRTLRELVASEPECIYCGLSQTPGAPLTLEHMPPISMFRGRQRPKGMEFATCRACNSGTRGADLVASYMARLDPSHAQPTWKMEEARSRLPKMQEAAPGVLAELFDPKRTRPVWRPNARGLMVMSVETRASGPRLKANLNAFCNKLALALYRQHVGSALPPHGAVETACYLNAGLPQVLADTYLSFMPVRTSLRQGRFDVGDQFTYRWNSDEKTIVIALASFHGALHVFIIATSQASFFRLPSGLPHTVFTTRSGWLDRLAELKKLNASGGQESF